jgi:HEAT repeat protein
MDRVDELLKAALEQGRPSDIDAWAVTGRAGLLRLRSYLEGALDLGSASPRVHPIDLLDNEAAAVAAIAAAHPDAFLEVFGDARWAAHEAVVIGLGEIDDPAATRRLMRATVSVDHWVRMRAAIGLGRRASSAASVVLGRLLEDPDDLVRSHALRSLERIGGAEALPSLRRLRSPSAYETTLARQAIESILARIDDGLSR